MHTCRTTYMLVQHVMWHQAYATCTVWWQSWWQGGLIAHSSLPASNLFLSSNETVLVFVLHCVDCLDGSFGMGGCGFLVCTDSLDVACLLVFRCSLLHWGGEQYFERGLITHWGAAIFRCCTLDIHHHSCLGYWGVLLKSWLGRFLDDWTVFFFLLSAPQDMH